MAYATPANQNAQSDEYDGLSATIPGISQEDFASIADDAKANCPISKLLNCEVTLEKSLAG